MSETQPLSPSNKPSRRTFGWSYASSTKIILFGLLTAYSLALLYAEFMFSQDFVRKYFAEIRGPTRLYAINTTLSTFLLWATALVFGVSIMCMEGKTPKKKEMIFYISQVLLFIYLGLDDRLRLHELIGGDLGINDAFIILGFGILEIGLIVFLGDLGKRPRRVRIYLYVAAILFGVMVFVDAFLPRHMILRLSCEDLSKMWADVFLFLFAWEICLNHIAQLKQRAQAQMVDG